MIIAKTSMLNTLQLTFQEACNSSFHEQLPEMQANKGIANGTKKKIQSWIRY
jgi:hypothetical protein